MEYRQLGRTGVKVSSLCLGCMMFGRRTEEDEAVRMVARAVEAGVNFLDTANVYSRGLCEQITGQAVKQLGCRDRIVLATKVHGRMSDDDPNAGGNSRRHIIEQCEASLRRLQTDWIDLYQIHRPDPTVPIDETLRALDDLVRQGKVRYTGTSTFAAWQIVESLWASDHLGLNRFVCEQPPYHPLDRRIERELVPMALTYGIGIIPWSPLAGGFFTGKYRRGEDYPEDSRLTGSKRVYGDAAFDVLDVFEQLAREKNASPSQVALAWNAAQPGITAPIIGPRTMEQMEDNLGAVGVEITDDDRQRIDQVSPPGRAVVPFYSADWGPHTGRWP